MILITGGAGYIGSHTCLALVEAGYDIVVLDNLNNSSIEPIKRVSQIVNQNIQFVRGDIRDYSVLDNLFSSYTFDAVIHFAGLKAVAESVEEPLKYYENNVFGSLQLLKIMQEHNVKNLVFSSSATVYGEPVALPLEEGMPLGIPVNAYGSSKQMIERILADLFRSDRSWNIVSLRYFNPVGAHESGLIGEDPKGVPTNLMPLICQVATRKLEELYIFGNDYDTYDGTGIRDYVHVMDLAEGHLKAVEKIKRESGIYTVNLGTGVGYSVLNIVDEFSKACGFNIPYAFKPRRPGDVAACYADPTYAFTCLGWKAKKGLKEMCEDAWRWQKNFPKGYHCE